MYLQKRVALISMTCLIYGTIQYIYKGRGKKNYM